jgi:hypothetical protein
VNEIIEVLLEKVETRSIAVDPGCSVITGLDYDKPSVTFIPRLIKKEPEFQ